MDGKAEEGWQELQAHIEGFFTRSLEPSGQRIEYKPRFLGLPGEWPVDRPEKKDK